jgi:hypothetical protein
VSILQTEKLLSLRLAHAAKTRPFNSPQQPTSQQANIPTGQQGQKFLACLQRERAPPPLHAASGHAKPGTILDHGALSPPPAIGLPVA